MRSIVSCTLLLSLLANTACRTTKPVSLEQLNALKPERAWVTNQDQSVVVVSSPQVVGDTLVGYVAVRYERVPSAGLKQVTVRTVAPARTALLAIGIAAAFAAAFLAVSPGSGGRANYGGIGDCDKDPTNPAC
jgi:hypothetical protein